MTSLSELFGECLVLALAVAVDTDVGQALGGEGAQGIRCNLHCFIQRVPVDSCTDGAEPDAVQAQFLCPFQTAAIGAAQEFCVFRCA